MATLTNQATFTIGDGTAVVETISVPILPGAAPGNGKGRLIHPTLGTCDYSRAPDEWVNVDTDVIIEPIWSGAKALLGTVNTFWQGDLTDSIVQERWTQDLNMPITMLRQLLSFWQTPPDPVTGTPVEWYPSYTNALGYNVIIFKIEVGSGLSGLSASTNNRGITLTPQQFRPGNWIDETVTITYRILGRVAGT